MQVNIFDNSCGEKIVSGSLVKSIEVYGTFPKTEVPILNLYLRNCGYAEAFPEYKDQR